jgi:hypothetical protein
VENKRTDERSPESVVAKISWILDYNDITEKVKKNKREVVRQDCGIALQKAG